jgi:hypothetical protein
MGQHEYENTPRGSPLEIDFTTTTRKLNFINKRVGVDTFNLGCVLLALETVKSWGNENWKRIVSKENEERNSEMKQKICNITDSCRSLLLLADYEEKRTKTLIQVVPCPSKKKVLQLETKGNQVYQFMAQKDATVNISLAKNSTTIAQASKEDSAVMRTIAIESKKDSSAMKTIAILGMLFLPGTFIAVSPEAYLAEVFRRLSSNRLSSRCQCLTGMGTDHRPSKLASGTIGQSQFP